MHCLQKLSSKQWFSALVNNVFPGIRLTKSEARLLPKWCPFLGGKRGSGLSIHQSGNVIAWLLLPKRVFKGHFFILSKTFRQGGTKSIIVCRLALGMECRVVRSGTRQCDTPSEQTSWCVLKAAKCLLSEANLWLRSLYHFSEITCFTMMGYPPLLLV